MKRRDFLGTTVKGGAAALALWATRLPAAELKKFKLGVISDEVTADLEPALLWAKEFGLEWVELRQVWGKNVTEMEPDNVKKAQDLLAKHSMKISVIDTPYFKIVLPGSGDPSRREGKNDPVTYDQQKPLLERAVARARDFGTDRIRIFSFWRCPDPKAVFDRIARELQNTATIAEKEHVRLVLENEYACNVATGVESIEMLNVVKSPAFGLNWDSGNAYAAGEHSPYPDGYEILDKSRIWHCHLKDAHLENGRSVWRPIGSGAIDFVGQFKALLADGYHETLSLETHYSNAAHNREQSSRESMVGLLDAIKRA
jgi:sugar phosphate isomerase/epimerase